MSNAIRVTLEGDPEGLVQALRDGETALEDFEETASETADDLQSLGTISSQTKDSLLGLNPAFAGNLEQMKAFREAIGFSNTALNEQIALLEKERGALDASNESTN